MLSVLFQKNSPSYLVSGTTFRNYIAPNLKAQFLFYINLVSDFVCRVGWANSLNKAFLENSFLTNTDKWENGQKRNGF